LSHFVVTTTKNRKSATVLDRAASSLTIGTRSTNALTVQDPVAAERHGLIEEQGGLHRLSDIGSTTGTFVNGVRVQDPTPLSEGDVIVLGTTRLTVKRATPSSLELELEEKAFQFQSSKLIKKSGTWVQGDREAWVESEVTFSRFPALRNAVWGALLVALLVPPLMLGTSTGRNSLAPGPLHPTHAALFDAPPGDPLHAEVAASGCEACHDPFAGTPMSKCYACHAEVQQSHPFQAEPHAQGWGPEACASCHPDHHGARTAEPVLVDLSSQWPGRSVTLSSRDSRFIPTAEATRSSCAECHRDDVEFERPGRVKTFLAERDVTEPPLRSVKVAYDGFSHARHVGDAGIACTTCHVPAEHEDRGADPRALRDFETLDFEGCMGCHADATTSPELVRHEDWAATAPSYAVRWHGATDDASRCATCHAELYSEELRTTERRRFDYVDAAGAPLPRSAQDPKLLFAYTIRHHTEQFEEALALVERGAATSADDDCSRCHVDGDWVTAGEAREGRFYHGLHLNRLRSPDELESMLATADGRAQLRQDSHACGECHAGIVSSRELAQPYYMAETDSCATCHRGLDDSSVPRVVSDQDRIRMHELVEQIDFPHDLHANWEHDSLRGGCFSCHGFGESAVAHRSPVFTPESVKTCRECHDRDHENIGGGACQVCHEAGDPVYRAALDDPSWESTKDWPALNRFSHFSAGHLESLQDDCSTCHPGVAAAATIGEVVVPSENNATCRDCHIAERQRFHWR